MIRWPWTRRQPPPPPEPPVSMEEVDRRVRAAELRHRQAQREHAVSKTIATTLRKHREANQFAARMEAALRGER